MRWIFESKTKVSKKLNKSEQEIKKGEQKGEQEIEKGEQKSEQEIRIYKQERVKMYLSNAKFYPNNRKTL